MALRIDPLVPHVWRSPTTLQFGVDRPRVVIDGVSNADERMIAALLRGVQRSVLCVIAESTGVPESRIDDLLATLAPVLQPQHEAADVPHAGSLRVVIDGNGPLAASVGALLAAEGLHVGYGAGDDEPWVDLAVLVADYVIEPGRHGAWLRRDTPHLALVAGDLTVRVGPLVEPGIGPCLYCLDLIRADADAAWPAIATQLLSRRSPLTSPLLIAEAATTAARAVCGRLMSGVRDLTDTSRVIDAGSGTVSVRRHRPHAGCGCRALPENVTALAVRRAADRSRPSSAEAPHALG